MKRRLLLALLAALPMATARAAAPATLQAATLHPILTDLARQIGGDRVNVTGLVPPGGDIHHFSPTTADVRRLANARVILAAGKHMENYLDKLRSNLSPQQQIIEVGRTIPSLKIETGDGSLFLCCPEHAQGAIDPHWWNSIDNMQRAARIVATAFTDADPDGKAIYKANASAFSNRLAGLKKWAKAEFAGIPANRRKIATAHLALSYFAKEYGFRLVPVQGLNHNVAPSSPELVKAVQTIRSEGIPAVFPEQGVNAKYLTQLSRETGVRVGGELVADGNGTGPLATFEAAFAHNVRSIAASLKP
jgi:zinc/manganese transport system substrate-binding protein